MSSARVPVGFPDAWSGDRRDPGSALRFGAEAGEPIGFLKARLVDQRRLRLPGCQWIGLRFFLRAGICPHFSRRCNPTGAGSVYALERSWVDNPRLALPIQRICTFFYVEYLVVALREPLAVAASLHARNGFSLNRGLVLW